jgi:hypothetical protein
MLGSGKIKEADMPGDNEPKDLDPGNEDREKILQMLKGGFETEHILEQRVRAPEADAGRKPDAGG